MKNFTKIVALSALISGSAQAIDKIVLEDFDYALGGLSTVSSGNIALFWGTYSGDTFITVGSGANSGFGALSGDDLTVTYAATNNNGVVAGTQLYLGFFDVIEGTSFASITPSINRAIITDATWLAPAFSTTLGTADFTFTTNTSAVFGSFVYNGGNETITLVTPVPEPSAFAALAGFGVLGWTVVRRRKVRAA